MPTASRTTGRCASAGRFRGPVYVAPDQQAILPGGDDPDRERASLATAIMSAIEDLTALAADKPNAIAAILDFQIEMLLDPELRRNADARIADGEGAALAWLSALDHHIDDFRSAEDDLARSRAADIVDIRDRVLARLSGKPLADFPAGTIYAGTDITPSTFLMHDWSHGGAILLSQGSSASHAAMLARARQVPMAVAMGRLDLAAGARVDLDVAADDVRMTIVSASPSDDRTMPAPGGRPEALHGSPSIRIGDGSDVAISLSVNDLGDLDRVDSGSVAGIGLLRSEFLIRAASDLADEERLRAQYQKAVDWAGGRPVTIRLFDFGGDKTLAGLDLGPSQNAMLGRRGVRLLLARPEILRVQARAILRVEGDIRVLVPMVTVPGEIAAVRAIFEEEARVVARRGGSASVPPLGMMVEVPAAALMLDRFAAADFFSLGTNDLGQYVAAAARDDEAFRPLIDESRQALDRLVAECVRLAQAAGKPISLCGDISAEGARLQAFVQAGLRHFSVAPARLAGLWSELEGMAGAASSQGGQTRGT